MQSTMNRERFKTLLFEKGILREDSMCIMFAYRIAKAAHQQQERDDGVRYFEHPRGVALILIEEFNSSDPDMIIAALLHDTVEDTFIFGVGDDACWSLKKTFGNNVMRFVLALSKERCSEEEKIERDRRYFAAIERADEKIKIIKCADRLHNLRDITHCTIQKKKHYLEETREHFLPMTRKMLPQVHEEMLQICTRLEEEINEVFPSKSSL